MQLPVIDSTDALVKDDRGSDDDDDDGSGNAGPTRVGFADNDEFSRERMLSLEHENAMLRAELASLAGVRLSVQHRVASICSVAPLMHPDVGPVTAALPYHSGPTASVPVAGDAPSTLRTAIQTAALQLAKMADTVGSTDARAIEVEGDDVGAMFSCRHIPD
jgi:hypothetical protein